MDGAMPGSTGHRSRLSVRVRRQDGTVVVAPVGELDHHTADVLRSPLEEAVRDGCERLVVDCSGLEFCDSTGLNVLLSARLEAEAAGGGVHLAGMRPAVARVFEITGAGAVFTVHGTVDDALSELPGV
ncbi:MULTISPECIES: STAS domain-containing protein [Streptomyces]|uniref:STAS domain-containing protein n=1 Tax=Streptomyces TaxID=1883 RepID=UPI0022497171|nr:STAS domain-containing protein [Streptomyces sp. JHD 1]MCX2971167.1 STAS domain-containing protein [Streptomyces sp. JHD 1]